MALNFWTRPNLPLHPISSTLERPATYPQPHRPPLEPQNNWKNTPRKKHFSEHLWKVVKSCFGAPKFLPRPNLPHHSNSSISREATSCICDPTGPCQSPRVTKNTPKIDNFKVYWENGSCMLFFQNFPNRIFWNHTQGILSGSREPSSIVATLKVSD